MKNKSSRLLEWLLFIFWILFVTAVNEWLISPLVEDYAAMGVVAVFVIVVIWLTSVPRKWRKKWITFTLFGLLLGQGLSGVAFYPLATRIPLGIILCLGLILVAFFYGKVRLSTLVISTIAMVVASTLLPVSEWPFLTHFSVVDYGRITLDPSDMSALPFSIVTTKSGQAVVTLENIKENKTDFLKQATTQTSSTDALSNYMRNFKHRYKLVEISKSAHGFQIGTPNSNDIASLNPDNFTNMFFPFNRAYWSVENGQIIQFMAPSQDPKQWIDLSLDAADYPTNLTGLSTDIEQAQQQNWSDVLSILGVSRAQPPLTLSNHRLVGTYNGVNIRVPVQSSSILGYGSFTSAGSHEVLLQGVNTLQVVSLDSGSGQVVGVYHGTTEHPLTNDLIIGAVDNSGRNVIFVNSSPAYILQANAGAGANWNILYTAPNPSLRFEGSVSFSKNSLPEIITDDPSYVRNVSTRYFSSYTFSHGNLNRNWRVYHTNVVNVRTVQFDKGGPTYIVAAIYATGKYLVLKRHFVPVVPITSALFALFVIVGWILSIRNRGVRSNG